MNNVMRLGLCAGMLLGLSACYAGAGVGNRDDHVRAGMHLGQVTTPQPSVQMAEECDYRCQEVRREAERRRQEEERRRLEHHDGS